MSKAEQLVYSVIDAQYATNTETQLPLIFHLSLHLSSNIDLLRQAYEIRADIVRVLDADQQHRQHIIDYMTSRTKKSMYDLNQYVDFSVEEDFALRHLYARLIKASARCLKTADAFELFGYEMGAVVRDHSSLLLHQLTTIRDAKLVTDTSFHPVCAEYSPALQLRILGLSRLHTLKEPILDIGCGKSGTLVRHLRDLGFQATGIDRDVTPSSYLIEADWASAPLGTGEWGTILSHMAFSNHFLHHHYRTDGRPLPYARLYIRILHALRPGGSFIYAPGLPFMKRLLPPDEYAVRNAGIDRYPEIYSTRVTRR